MKVFKKDKRYGYKKQGFSSWVEVFEDGRTLKLFEVED
jgi:hypothetical protein